MQNRHRRPNAFGPEMPKHLARFLSFLSDVKDVRLLRDSRSVLAVLSFPM